GFGQRSGCADRPARTVDTANRKEVSTLKFGTRISTEHADSLFKESVESVKSVYNRSQNASRGSPDPRFGLDLAIQTKQKMIY
ncbi:MAG: hypothetical protein ACK2UQ_00720, partial [Anaerolineae bacterium]